MTQFARTATGVFAALAAWSLSEPHLLRVRRFDVEMANLPPAAEGLRVVQLSDFHCSAITSRHIARRAVQTANAQKPDVIVLTGDYVSRPNSYAGFLMAGRWAKSPMEYARQVAHEIGNLRAPEGVWAVHGNHDESAGGFKVLDNLLEQNGVRVLTNSSTRLRGLPLVGLDDLRVGRTDVRQACEGIEQAEAQVVLSHNPRILPLLNRRNALVLSGHTHSGQVHLPFSRYRRRPFDMQGSRFNEGWYQNGEARLYVSAGIGSVHLPLRFCCPPEITVFTLKNRTRISYTDRTDLDGSERNRDRVLDS